MDQPANIDTIGFGYEETVYEEQPPVSNAETPRVSAEAQVALSLAGTLQQLRSNRLNGQDGAQS